MPFSDALIVRSLFNVPSSSSRAPSLRALTSSATASASWVAKRSSNSVPPALEIGGDEGVVSQLGIGRVQPVDAGTLAGTERLVRVEALDRGHQPLAAQDLVTARD